MTDLDDMREHVPFLAAAIDGAESELNAQLQRSATVYGTTNDARWPASAYVQVRDMRAALGELRRQLAASREYLAELEASALLPAS